MLRPFLFVGGLVFALTSAAPFGLPYARLAQAQATPLDAVKTAVLAATGYDGTTLELAATDVQFVVTIVNSKLNDLSATERENEANRIVATITHNIADRPEFKGIQAIHVDYVRREMGGGHTETIDGLDFRRDQQGNFRHHIT